MTVFVGPHFRQLPVRTTIETLGWWAAVTVRSAGPPKHLVERNFVELVEVTDIVAGQPAAPGRSELGRARSRHPDFANGAEPEAVRGGEHAHGQERLVDSGRGQRNQSTERLGLTQEVMGGTNSPNPTAP